MAFYAFYFLDGKAVIVEVDDGKKDRPDLAFNKHFGTHPQHSDSKLRTLDFYERFDHAVTENDLGYEFDDGDWHKVITDLFVQRMHPQPIIGSMRNLWSWFSGSFHKCDEYSLVPLVVFDESDVTKGKEVSVPFGVDCGEYYEMTNTDCEFDRIWKTLPRTRTNEEYMSDCARIVGRTTESFCVVLFPACPDYPEDVSVKAVCDFVSGNVTFSIFAKENNV